MFLVKILRLLLGYVEFTASQGFCERFINLCNFEGIVLWDIRYKDNSLCACTSAKDYKRIRGPARKSGVKVRIERKRGLPFVTFRHRSRVGLAAGFVVLVAFVCFMSSIVWEMDVTGNTTVNTEDIIEAVESEGVKIGAFKNKINTNLVEKNALAKLPDISWLSVNILGSKIRIEVRETVKNPEIIDLKTPVNIVAEKGGVIKLIEVFIGEKVIAVNESVAKGDLLISGVTVNSDKSEILRHADGRVFAETDTYLYGEANIRCDRSIVASVENVYYLDFFSLKIPLTFGGDNYYSTDIMVKGKKSVLPIGITRGVRYEFEPESNEISREQAGLLALLSLVKSERSSFTEYEREEIVRSEMQKENSVVIKGEYKGIENIAEQKPIYTDTTN